MTAIFNFQSLLVVILLVICTCAYVHATAPALLDRNKHGFPGLLWKAARVGERLSPYVSLSCIAMGGLAVFPILVFGAHVKVYGGKAYVICSVALLLDVLGSLNTFCGGSPLLIWAEGMLCVTLASVASLAWMTVCRVSCHGRRSEVAMVITSICWCLLSLVCVLRICAIVLQWHLRNRPPPPVVPQAMIHA